MICPDAAMPIKNIAVFADRFKKLPFVLVGLSYGASRDVNSLLNSYDNIYISLGHNYTIQGVVEQLVNRYGGERFVLGTGFPLVDPSCAVTQFSYARINKDEKKSIGYGNLERIMGEVNI